VKEVFGVLLLVACYAQVAAAQRPESELIPLDGDLATRYFDQYHQVVREHLLGRATGASALVIPSFQKEWAVQIARDRGHAFAIYAIMDTQLWGALQQRLEQEPATEAEVLRKLRLPVSRSTAELGDATARAVEAAWAAMHSAARMPSTPRRIIDGTSYWFFGPGADKRTGLSRSPEATTPAGALVDLVEALRNHVTSRKPSDTEPDLLRKATDVLSRARGSASSMHRPTMD